MFDVYLGDRRNHLLLVAMGQPISINQQLGPRRADVALPGSFHGEGVAQHLANASMPNGVSNWLGAALDQRLIGAAAGQGELLDDGRRQYHLALP